MLNLATVFSLDLYKEKLKLSEEADLKTPL